MKYTNKEKEYLNKIFKYTRKINKTPIKEIISKTGISTSTYYQLEKGHISKDEIYDKLINAFNLKYVPFDGAISYFEDKVITIQKLVEYLDIDSLTRELDEIENKFNKYNKYIFYQEIFLIIQSIRNHFILNNRAIDRDAWDKLYNIYLSDNSPMKYVLLEILGTTSWNIFGGDTFNLIKNEIVNNCPLYLYNIKSTFVMTYNYYKSLTILVDNIDKIKDNKIRYFRFNIALFGRIYDIDPISANEYRKNIINGLNDSKTPVKDRESALYSLLIKHFIAKEYKEIIVLYKKYNLPRNYNNFLYLLSLNRLGMPISNDLLNEEMCLNSYYTNILKYIKLKHDKYDYSFLESFLMTDVLNNLKCIGKKLPFWPYFFDELSWMVTKTRNYKSLLTFKKEMDKMN